MRQRVTTPAALRRVGSEGGREGGREEGRVGESVHSEWMPTPLPPSPPPSFLLLFLPGNPSIPFSLGCVWREKGGHVEGCGGQVRAA